MSQAIQCLLKLYQERMYNVTAADLPLYDGSQAKDFKNWIWNLEKTADINGLMF